MVLKNMENEDEIGFGGGNDSRNSLQKAAMTAIYDVLTCIDMKEDINVENIVSALLDAPYEECDYFVKAAVVLSIRDMDKIVEKYNANMNKWTFDRLNRVEQAILLLSYVHFYYIEPDVQKGVVIDIAIKLAKLYLGDKDYKFVNAILDHVLQREESKDED